MDTQETIEKLREWEQRLSASPLPFDRELGYLFRSAPTHLEGAQADTQRLDWLETSRFDVDYWKEWRVSNPDTNAPCFVGTSVREAIDSAIAAQQ